MHLPTARRPLRPALLAGLLAAVALLPAAAPEQRPVLRAVVSYDGAVPDLPGVQVLRTLRAVGALVVETTASDLSRLAAVPGVRGVAPDSALQLTGGPGEQRAVRASEALGGRAGQADAGAGVRVAVVDTGVSDTPALARRSGRLVDAFDAGGANGPLTDGYGHGTFMASVVAGGVVDGEPVGVAPAAQVLVVRVAERDGTTSLSRVLAGLDWIARHAGDVDVANLALSHERPGAAYGADPLTDAVDDLRELGVVVVVSAGNDPAQVGDPGFSPRALTVGAADLTAGEPVLAPFSGRGEVAGVTKPDVVASGVSVLGVLPPSSAIARAHPDARMHGRLWRGSGTSAATAVTSGAAAVVLGDHPTATATQVKAALRRAATDLPGDGDGQGLLRLPSGALVDGALEPGTPGDGGDPTGEASWDANSWSANSWSANSWSANSWSANSWSANSWSGRWGARS